jgi:putative membrane protein insertion efficiency factor
MKWVLIGLLKAYRAVISPLYGNVCKYYPSCSAYALEAVTDHGAIRAVATRGLRVATTPSRALPRPRPGRPSKRALNR